MHICIANANWFWLLLRRSNHFASRCITVFYKNFWNTIEPKRHALIARRIYKQYSIFRLNVPQNFKFYWQNWILAFKSKINNQLLLHKLYLLEYSRCISSSSKNEFFNFHGNFHLCNLQSFSRAYHSKWWIVSCGWNAHMR